MKEIQVDKFGASKIIDIVHQMRSLGWVQGQDFDFAFHQPRWDDMIGEIPNSTVFTFYDEKYATMFILKFL
jgi:hypothetical protein